MPEILADFCKTNGFVPGTKHTDWLKTAHSVLSLHRWLCFRSAPLVRWTFHIYSALKKNGGLFLYFADRASQYIYFLISTNLIIIIKIFIYCNWIVTRWQWLFYMYKKTWNWLLLRLLFLFLNINQLDALNFIISLFQASTCFEHMCLSSGGQNCITQSLVSSHL